MVIGIDMDDVLENLSEAWIAELNKRYGTHVVRDDILDWDFTKAFPGLTKEQVYDVMNEEGFWKTVTPMQGAVEGVQKLMDDGHEVYVVTTTYYKNVRQKMEDVLFRYFPMIDWKHVIIVSKKQMVLCDILIDDGVHNLIGGDFVKILVDAPYNRNFPEKSYLMKRAHNWDEIVYLVREQVEYVRMEEMKRRAYGL